MPDSWANAFSPTIALLRGIGMPVMFDSMREVGYRRVVLMPVSRLKNASRVFSAITTSSSEQLPARSPMPLMVHSIWRAPATTAARLFATARPRSSWQCTDSADLVDAAHVLAQVAEQLGELVGHGVADRVRNVHGGRAGLDDRFDDLREEIELGARGVFGRELDVVGQSRARSSRPRPRCG